MNRRRYLLSSSTIGIAGIAGCLNEEVCDETSNHLYVENNLSEPQLVTVRVYRLHERLLRDNRWVQLFSDTLEVPGERRLTIEQLYDTQGMYRTEAEHNQRLEQNRSEIDDCEDQVVTIGIGDGLHSIMNGRPDELLPEADSNPTSSQLPV